MKEEQFVALAVEAGYSREEINDLLEFHNDTGVPFDEMPLLERIVN